MNWQENWWKFLVLGLVVVGLIWWRNSKNTPDESLQTDAEQLEQQVNQYLEDTGIELPEGGERANLRAVALGIAATGVVSRIVNEADNTETYTVIVSLPDTEVGWYEAWAKNSEGEVMKLGKLRLAKGGYLLEVTPTAELEGYSAVVISKETSETDAPTEVVMEGEFEEKEAEE